MGGGTHVISYVLIAEQPATLQHTSPLLFLRRLQFGLSDNHFVLSTDCHTIMPTLTFRLSDKLKQLTQCEAVFVMQKNT